MKQQEVQVSFENNQNPKAKFDLLSLEKLLNRSDLNHNPCQLHLINFYIIIFVESGQGYHTIDFTDYKVSKGFVL